MMSSNHTESLHYFLLPWQSVVLDLLCHHLPPHTEGEWAQSSSRSPSRSAALRVAGPGLHDWAEQKSSPLHEPLTQLWGTYPCTSELCSLHPPNTHLPPDPAPPVPLFNKLVSTFPVVTATRCTWGTARGQGQLNSHCSLLGVRSLVGHHRGRFPQSYLIMSPGQAWGRGLSTPHLTRREAGPLDLQDGNVIL